MMVVFAIIAILMLIDYRFVKNTVTETIIDKHQRLENRQSVARNFYYAYYVKTTDHTIAVSKEFQKMVKEGNSISVEKSLLFDEVNRVTIADSGISELYSFRTAVGLILPSLVLIILGVGYKLGDRVSTLVFVSEVVLLFGFVFVLL